MIIIDVRPAGQCCVGDRPGSFCRMPAGLRLLTCEHHRDFEPAAKAALEQLYSLVQENRARLGWTEPVHSVATG